MLSDYNGPQRLASLYVKMGRNENAIEVCRETIRTNPKNSEAYRILTKAYLQLGRNKEAIETSKQAVREMADSASEIYELGLTYLATGDKQAALAQQNGLSQAAQNAKDPSKKKTYGLYAKMLLERINK
jgi:tetratricopeptide (TPR) repeat protein